MREARDILDAWDAIRRRGGHAVLATIVEVSGSTYRRPGARMLLGDDGSAVGLLSGGCLEGDLVERSRAVLDSGSAVTIVYDMTGRDELVWGLGLGCAGKVHVLLEPLPARLSPDPLQLLRQAIEQRRDGSVATVYHSADPARVPVGARVGCESGSTGDGLLDRRIRSDLPVRVTASRRYATPSGSFDVLLESIAPPQPLVILGGGPDALPLVRLAKQLGWHVTVIDHRPSFARAANFPGADRVMLSGHEDPLAGVAPDEHAAAVVMTHKFLHDVELLERLLASPVRYIGLLGPKARTGQLLGALAERGIEPDAERLACVFGPVGLDLGAETPEEIALSILAEIRAVLGGRRGGFLRERDAPLHEPQG